MVTTVLDSQTTLIDAILAECLVSDEAAFVERCRRGYANVFWALEGSLAKHHQLGEPVLPPIVSFLTPIRGRPDNEHPSYGDFCLAIRLHFLGFAKLFNPSDL